MTVWAMIIITHTVFLHLYYEFPLVQSATDSVVFNGTIAGLGFFYGFAFRFISLGNHSVNTTVSYAALILAGMLIVLLSFKHVMLFIFATDATFVLFVNDTLILRATASGLYFAIIILLYYLLKYTEDLHEKVLNEANLQQIIQQTALDALKSQLNPHFIFNSLNSISSLTISNPEKAQQMVIKLSDFLRRSLQNGDKKTRTLAQEMETIQLYLDIEKIRFGDRLSVLYKISDECLSVQLPNMILQPLFENAIKFGLYDTLDDVEIITSAVVDKSILTITITNPYDSKTQPPKGKGIGLKNTEQRLKIHYRLDHVIVTTKTNDTFAVTLNIPVSL
jgi:LytS/YehU family sensor histidine kinase